MKRSNALQFTFIVAFVFLALAALAQVATNPPPVGGSGGSIPTSIVGYWDLVIAAIAPLIVQGIKWMAPRIPKWVLPASTPVIGLVLGLGLNYFNVHHYTWFDAAKAGALAVFIRETWNQTVTKYFSGSSDAGTPTPPAK